MDMKYIDRKIEVVNRALAWGEHPKEAEGFTEDRKKLVDIRRELNKIRFAASENSSVAAFGESQMGKSYMISALLSEPGKPFKVKNGGVEYNFIEDINPSETGGENEATGVVTRFSTHLPQNNETHAPENGEIDGYVKAQLLSVADIVLILCEAFYSNMKHSANEIWSSEKINSALEGISIGITKNDNAILDEDDVRNIQEYLVSIGNTSSNVINSNLFEFLFKNVTHLGNDQIKEIMKLCWYGKKLDNDNAEINTEISDLWDALIEHYGRLEYETEIYVEFNALLRNQGTLLSVERLSELSGKNKQQFNGNYQADARVRLKSKLKETIIPKAYLSALIAELRIMIPENGGAKDFMSELDLLDFPGERRPNQDTEENVDIGEIFRRGKVTYLFNKYSAAKRIRLWLFCHNHRQSAQSSMPKVIERWVNSISTEPTPNGREKIVEDMGGDPLFIISTWFNKSLEHVNELPGQDLSAKWETRFVKTLQKDILKSCDSNGGDKEEHWFNNWTTSHPKFNNVYVLRDYTYSTMIFKGYNAKINAEEGDEIIPDTYPGFRKDLRQSFLDFPFVKEHISNPEYIWDMAATRNHDGTIPIIDKLNKMAPNVKDAADKKFESDLNDLMRKTYEILDSHHSKGNEDEEILKAKKMAARVCTMIDSRCGDNPYFFGHLLDSLMLPEAKVYELVFAQLHGKQLPTPILGREAAVFLAAGLDTKVSVEENKKRLMKYTEAETEAECKSRLIEDAGIELDSLLGKIGVIYSQANSLVELVERYWHEQFLSRIVEKTLSKELPLADKIVDYLWRLYQVLDMRSRLAEGVNHYIKTLKGGAAGIVSDYLALEFNQFVSTFGQRFMTDEKREELKEKNERLNLGLDLSSSETDKSGIGVELLAKLDEAQTASEEGRFDESANQLRGLLPQFKSQWEWEKQLRIGFVYANKLPSYDPVLNKEMGEIIDMLNSKSE